MNETIYSDVCSLKNLTPKIVQIWIDKYKLTKTQADQVIDNTVQPYIDELREDLYCIVEYPYVDKLYRDTFYNYYSSKLELNRRDSIRISLFDTEIKESDFFDTGRNRALKENLHYLGFITLRPTFPKVIGRTALSPKAKKNRNFLCCLTKINTTVNFIKYDVHCFPHSSQDNQTITCAETTIWSLLEYFGNKYPEYKPVLPSTIHRIMDAFSYKRLMPSEGLTAEQVTFAVRQLGFGAMIYSSSRYDESLYHIISTYVESGIPIVGVLNDNEKGHAVNIIGREILESQKITSAPVQDIKDNTKHSINIIDFNKVPCRYVFIDDNHVPYQLARLKDPCRDYYKEESWHKCKITSVIVPLYSKIYLEAAKARHNFYQYLKNTRIGIADDETRVVKLFLASSRSYKEYLALNKELNEQIKSLFLGKTMPKFIWVGEISKSTSFEKGHCDGIILQDATEPVRHSDDTFGSNLSLIAGYLDDKYFTNNFGNFEISSTFAGSFESFKNNLR